MFLSEFGFREKVYPVNPRHPPDLAVIAIPGASAIRAVTDAADLGIKGTIIMSSGFAEGGGEAGHDRQETIVDYVSSASRHV
jgi:acyl-CoA synthetase (NDP forming)